MRLTIRSARAILIGLAVASAVTSTTIRLQGQARGGGTPASLREGEAFHAALVNAIAAGNRQQVAGLFAYPIKVSVAGLPNPIAVQNAASLVRMYPLFFGPELRCAIEESQVPAPGAAPPAHKLLIADGVVSVDNGRIIAERTVKGLRVTRMSVNAAAPARRTPPPHVVTFVTKGQDAQYTGRLARDYVDAYVVTARPGQTLQARIDRFPGSALSLAVVDAGDGHAITGVETARMWRGTVPEAKSYRIEVAKRSAYCDPDVTYLLTVTLR